MAFEEMRGEFENNFRNGGSEYVTEDGSRFKRQKRRNVDVWVCVCVYAERNPEDTYMDFVPDSARTPLK